MSEVYVVVNADGAFFHRKGHGGYGATWVEEFDKARIFQKLSQARARVTFFAREYPSYPTPAIWRYDLGSPMVMAGEAERTAIKVAAINAKKAQRDARAAEIRRHRCPSCKESIRA